MSAFEVSLWAIGIAILAIVITVAMLYRRRNDPAWVNVFGSGERSEGQKLFDQIAKTGCVVCSMNPGFSVYEGPSGGMSQNVWCSYCGTRYNMSIFPPQQGQRGPEGIAEIINEKERFEEFERERIQSADSETPQGRE